MEQMTPAAIFALILGGASAFVLLTTAVEKIVMAVKAAKAPNLKQDDRLDALEAWRVEVDRKLLNDNVHLASIDSEYRLALRALLALLDHGIDGNNTKQMQNARTELHDHLINR